MEVLPKRQTVSVSQNLKNVPSLSQEKVKCRPSLSAEIAPNPLCACSVPFQISRAHFKGDTHGFLKVFWPSHSTKPVMWRHLCTLGDYCSWRLQYFPGGGCLPVFLPNSAHSTLQIHVTIMTIRGKPATTFVLILAPNSPHVIEHGPHMWSSLWKQGKRQEKVQH